MGRRKRSRWIDFRPRATCFCPRGIRSVPPEEVELTLDELEAVRLADLDELDQIKAARRMKISQSTFQRILTAAHQKIAKALVLGRIIRFKGGEIMMSRSNKKAVGSKEICVCCNPDCRCEVPCKAGIPCCEVECKCGSPMVRKRA